LKTYWNLRKKVERNLVSKWACRNFRKDGQKFFWKFSKKKKVLTFFLCFDVSLLWRFVIIFFTSFPVMEKARSFKNMKKYCIMIKKVYLSKIRFFLIKKLAHFQKKHFKYFFPKRSRLSEQFTIWNINKLAHNVKQK